MSSSIEKFVGELDTATSKSAASPSSRRSSLTRQDPSVSRRANSAVTVSRQTRGTAYLQGIRRIGTANAVEAFDDDSLLNCTPDILLAASREDVTENDQPVPDIDPKATEAARSAEPSLALPGHRFELPHDKLIALGHLSVDEPKSELAEQFRTIKRPLLANLKRDESELCRDNVLMVTSCVAGEGKSFCALNLALSLSMERDLEVVLVDADVAKASTSALLGFEEGHRGLIDRLVTHDCTTASVLYQTDLDGLLFMPVGTRHDHSSELLSSEMMHTLVGELAGAENRVLLFDAPPVLQTNEANVLSRQIGQAIFIVAAESTSHSMVAEALTAFEPDCRVGLILNKARKRNPGKYGYAYGYGYDTVRPLGSSQQNGTGA